MERQKLYLCQNYTIPRIPSRPYRIQKKLVCKQKMSLPSLWLPVSSFEATFGIPLEYLLVLYKGVVAHDLSEE
jgi:hypothetical protein